MDDAKALGIKVLVKTLDMPKLTSEKGNFASILIVLCRNLSVCYCKEIVSYYSNFI